MANEKRREAHIGGWGRYAPTRVLIFNGDLPTPDDPLPKFLSDVDAGKLMRAAATAALLSCPAEPMV